MYWCPWSLCRGDFKLLSRKTEGCLRCVCVRMCACVYTVYIYIYTYIVIYIYIYRYIYVERGSSAVGCRTRNQVSPGSNPPLLPFRRLGIFVLSIVVPVDSAV